MVDMFKVLREKEKNPPRSRKEAFIFRYWSSFDKQKKIKILSRYTDYSIYFLNYVCAQDHYSYIK